MFSMHFIKILCWYGGIQFVQTVLNNTPLCFVQEVTIFVDVNSSLLQMVTICLIHPKLRLSSALFGFAWSLETLNDLHLDPMECSKGMEGEFFS